MGSTTIGIPDTSQLPIQSDTSQYDLRNASAALNNPDVVPPPRLTPDQSIAELEANRLQTIQNPPQYQPDFQQPDVQQQFQQPQFHNLQPLIDAYAARLQQDNQQRGGGVMKHLLTSFLGGGGRAMMMSVGLPTPEMQHQEQLRNLIALSHAQSEAQNAASNQQLKDIETQRYALDVAQYPVYGANGKPLTDASGKIATYPKWQAAQLQEYHNRIAGQRLSPEDQAYLESYNQLISEGKSPKEAHDALQRQPAESIHTVNTAEGVKQYDPASKTWRVIGGSPKSNINLMTASDAKDIADAIESGDQPPTLQGLYRSAGPVRAELARRGFPLAQAETDWKAVQKHTATLNGPQQTRLMQSIVSASDMLEKIFRTL
jgi:hypothetical protein